MFYLIFRKFNLFAFIILLLGVGGCGDSSVQKEKKITIAVSETPLSLPFFIAAENGFFEQEGVNVKMVRYKGGHRTMKAMLEGKADLATTSDIPIMFSSFSNSDFRIISTFVSSSGDVKIITRKDSRIFSGKDLKGKRVGVVKGGSSQYLLDHFLIFDEILPEEVIKIGIEPEAMARAIAEKEVDAVVPWEPFAYDAVKLLKDNVHIIPYSKAIYQETFNLVAMKKFLEKNREESVKILKALQRAIVFIDEKSEKSKEIIVHALNKDRDFIDWIWNDFNFSLSLNQYLIHMLEGEARWAKQNGLASGENIPNYLKLICSEFLEEVDQSSITIIEEQH